MASQPIQRQPIWLGKLRLDGQINSIDLDNQVEVVDAATLDDKTAIVAATRFGFSMSLSGFWDTADAIDGELQSAVGAVRPFFIDVANAGEGGVAYVANPLIQARPFGGSHGQLNGMSIAGLASEVPAIRGILECMSEGISASRNTGGSQLGAVATGSKLYAAISVSGGSSIDLDSKVVSDDNGSFSSATDRITFANLTDLGYEWASVAGPITDDYFRVELTVNSGTDLDVAVAIGIL